MIRAAGLDDLATLLDLERAASTAGLGHIFGPDIPFPEADVLARPDPKTFQLLPWHHDDAQVARVFCDIANLDATPFEGDPRFALRRTLERAEW